MEWLLRSVVTEIIVEEANEEAVDGRRIFNGAWSGCFSSTGITLLGLVVVLLFLLLLLFAASMRWHIFGSRVTTVLAKSSAAAVPATNTAAPPAAVTLGGSYVPL